MSIDRSDQRFVITGMGMVSGLGHDVESNWSAVLNGKNAIVSIKETLLANYPTVPVHLAAPAEGFSLMNNPVFAKDRKGLRKWDLSQQFGLWAGEQALRQANLLSNDSLIVNDRQVDPERFGVYMGTAIGGADTLGEGRLLLERERLLHEEYHQAVIDGDDEKIARLSGRIFDRTRLKPTAVLNALPGRVAATPSLVFGAKAFWKGVLQECASGNGAIISAIEAIKLGKADVVLAGGVEGEISGTTTAHFAAAGAASESDDPDKGSSPLDESRSGLIMGQGAGVVVVEDMDHAVNRGAPILAEVIGYAENADSKYETEPDPVSVLRCMVKAWEVTGLSPRKLDGISINFHATSTEIGDPVEMTAVDSAYEKPRNVVGITATKAGRGHTFGASGAIEAIESIQALRDGKTPPIRNLRNPIPEAKDFQHAMSGEAPIEADVQYVANNSFGFGGNNAITIFTKPR